MLFLISEQNLSQLSGKGDDASQITIDSSASSTENQIGAGIGIPSQFSEQTLKNIATIIATQYLHGEGTGLIPKVLEKEESVNSDGGKDSLKTQLQPFDAKNEKNDLNDSFDEQRLLAFVPKSKKHAAQKLLKIFDERGSELTWNSSGTVFIDQIAIPNSNIFIYFPYLFKQKKPQNLEGYDDFFVKVIDMGLADYISQKPIKKNISALPLDADKNDEGIPWWYLGD